MLVTFLLILICLILFYIFLTWNFNYWTKRGIIGPRPKLFTGNFPNAFSQKYHLSYDIDQIYRVYKHKADFVGIINIRSPQLLVTCPTLCRRILVNDFKNFHDNEISTMIDKKSDFLMGSNAFVATGEEWKEYRALLNPRFSMGKLKAIYPVTIKLCKDFKEYIKKQIRMKPKDGIDANLCLHFTSEVVSVCALGIKAESFTEGPTPILDAAKTLFETSFGLVLYGLISSFIPAIKKIRKLTFFPKHLENFFISLLQKSIDLRKSQEVQNDCNDFLQYMIQLQDKKGLTTKDIAAITMTFLLDGFETISLALAHVLLMLGRYSAVQERLRDEILANIDENGVIEFNNLNELPYLDAFIHEAIRIFPAAAFGNKICTEPIVLRDKNGQSVQVEKGVTVVLPFYSFMMDEEKYPNPQELRPERFLEENGGSVRKFREEGFYHGFDDGPRTCLGMRFALVQMKAVLVEIVRDFNIRVNPKTRYDNKLDPKSFLGRFDGRIWIEFEERT